MHFSLSQKNSRTFALTQCSNMQYNCGDSILSFPLQITINLFYVKLSLSLQFCFNLGGIKKPHHVNKFRHNMQKIGD